MRVPILITLILSVAAALVGGGAYMVYLHETYVPPELENVASITVTSPVMEVNNDHCQYSYIWQNTTMWCFYERVGRCAIYGKYGCVLYQEYCDEPNYTITFDPSDPLRTTCEVHADIPERYKLMFGFGIAMIVMGGITLLIFIGVFLLVIYDYLRTACGCIRESVE